MSLRSQTQPYVLVGDTIADLPNPSSVAQGTIFHAHTGEAFVLSISPATGVRSWETFQSSAADTSWPKYVVAPTLGPRALFTSIQTAIDTAAADGHNAANPTVVLVFPGAYSENGAALVMRPGIDVVGFSSSLDAVFTGNIVVAFSSSGSVGIENLDVAGALQIAGSVSVGVLVTKCAFGPNTGDALQYADTASSTVILTDSSFTANGGNGNGIITALALAVLVADRCTFTSNGSGNAAFLTFNNPNIFNRCTFNGNIVGTAGTGTPEFNDCVFNPIATNVMTIPNGASATIRGGKISGSPTDPMFNSTTGTGTLSITDIGTPGHITTAATVSGILTNTFRDYNESNITGTSPFTIPAANITDVMTVTQAGAWTITLPPLSGVISGQRATVTNLSPTAGVLTMTPNGTNTVQTQASYVTAGACRAVTLQARSSGGTFDWRIIAISPL